MLERHQETVRRAEERSRLVFATAGPPAARWAAERLRWLADRLDGGAAVESEGARAGLSATSSL